ncbi:MAG TPA: hypothetical protein DCW86_02145 [Actinobacteria bacterium]|nr:hypothetical protein [Actinomycetota bacterium]
MTDKDVQRNVRSMGEEGVQTPTQKHLRSIGQRDNFPFGEGPEEKKEKEKLLAKFHERELRLRKKAEESRKEEQKKS